MHNVLQDIYQRGELLACLGCAIDKSSRARINREFDETTQPAWCDFCGAPLTCELRAYGNRR